MTNNSLLNKGHSDDVEQFEEACAKMKTLTKRPTDEELLEIYALYKQATVGDNKGSKPGITDLKSRYKWEAWENIKGMNQDNAKQQYINKTEEFLKKYT